MTVVLVDSDWGVYFFSRHTAADALVPLAQQAAGIQATLDPPYTCYTSHAITLAWRERDMGGVTPCIGADIHT